MHGSSIVLIQPFIFLLFRYGPPRPICALTWHWEFHQSTLAIRHQKLNCYVFSQDEVTLAAYTLAAYIITVIINCTIAIGEFYFYVWLLCRVKWVGITGTMYRLCWFWRWELVEIFVVASSLSCTTLYHHRFQRSLSLLHCASSYTNYPYQITVFFYSFVPHEYCQAQLQTTIFVSNDHEFLWCMLAWLAMHYMIGLLISVACVDIEGNTVQ